MKRSADESEPGRKGQLPVLEPVRDPRALKRLRFPPVRGTKTRTS